MTTGWFLQMRTCSKEGLQLGAVFVVSKCTYIINTSNVMGKPSTVMLHKIYHKNEKKSTIS